MGPAGSCAVLVNVHTHIHMQCLWYTNSYNKYVCTINCTHMYMPVLIRNMQGET